MYKGLNQKLPSYLLGNQWVVNAINYALADIYTFEWKYWTFMYDSYHIDLTTVDPTLVTVEVNLPHPILRAVKMVDMWMKKISNFDNINVEPFNTTDNIWETELFFKPHTKKIKVYNNKVWYILHYIHYFDQVDYEWTLPVPSLFEWVLFNLTLWYIYPNYWQMWENKEANVFSKSRQQLTDLAKTDSLQLSWIEWNIK